MASNHHPYCDCSECMRKFELKCIRKLLHVKIDRALDEYEAQLLRVADPASTKSI